jgi:hypothetical protein
VSATTVTTQPASRGCVCACATAAAKPHRSPAAQKHRLHWAAAPRPPRAVQLAAISRVRHQVQQRSIPMAARSETGATAPTWRFARGSGERRTRRAFAMQLQTDLALISMRCRSSRSCCCSSRSQSLQAALFYSRPLHRGRSGLSSRTSEGTHDALLRRSPKDCTRSSKHNLALISNRCRSSRSQSLQAAPSRQLQSILPRAVEPLSSRVLANGVVHGVF